MAKKRMCPNLRLRFLLAGLLAFALVYGGCVLILHQQRLSIEEEIISALTETGRSVLSSGATSTKARVATMSVLAGSFMGGRGNFTEMFPRIQIDTVVAAFGRFGGDTNLLRALSFHAYITDAERPRFELETNDSIRTTNPAPQPGFGPPFPPHALDVYLPMAFAWPAHLLIAEWVNVDLRNRTASRGPSMDRTIATGEPVAENPNFLVARGEPLNFVPFNIVVPSTEPSKRPADGVLSFFVLLQAFAQLFDSPEDLPVTLIDETNGQDKLITLLDQTPDDDQALVFISDIRFTIAGRTWYAKVSALQSTIDHRCDANLNSWMYHLIGAVLGVAAALSVIVQFTLRLQRAKAARTMLVSGAVTETHTKMLRVMNHELRNPLTVLMGGIDMLCEPDDDLDPAEVIVPLQSACMSMQRALDDLLDIRQVQMGTFAVQSVTVETRNVLRDIRHYLSACVSQGRTPKVACEQDVPKHLVLDPSRTRQLVVDTAYHMQEYTRDLGLFKVKLERVKDIAIVFSMNDLVSLSKSDELALLGKQKPSAIELALANAGWSPRAAHSPVGAAHRAAVTASSSNGSYQDTSDRSSLGALDLVVCQNLAEALGGTIAFRLVGNTSVMFVALPLQTPSEDVPVSVMPRSASPAPPSRQLQPSPEPAPLEEPAPALDLTVPAVHVVVTSPPAASTVDFQIAGEEDTAAKAEAAPAAAPVKHATPEPTQAEEPEVKAAAPVEAAAAETKAGAVAAAAAEKKPAEAESKSDSAGSTTCVCVVDDEKLIRKMVARRLKKEDCDVTVLEDGDELAPYLHSVAELPSFVLLDIVMRRSNGAQVLEELRKEPKWSELPVYAMTSNVEDIENYKKIGFSGLLNKPFGKVELVKIRKHAATVRGAPQASFIHVRKRK